MALAVYVCLLLVWSCLSCDAILPSYIPAIQANHVQRYDLIRKYFHLGFNYAEILAFLILTHGIQLSLRQLKRVLRSQGLFRWRGHSDPHEITGAVELELHGSGCLIGYQLMHQRLRSDYGLVVGQEIVRLILWTLDPEGVERWSSHRLRRRQYYVRGPDYIWHIDGYDKLKPFRFCIHGAIDGYRLLTMIQRLLLGIFVTVLNNWKEFQGLFPPMKVQRTAMLL